MLELSGRLTKATEVEEDGVKIKSIVCAFKDTEKCKLYSSASGCSNCKECVVLDLMINKLYQCENILEECEKEDEQEAKS